LKEAVSTGALFLSLILGQSLCFAQADLSKLNTCNHILQDYFKNCDFSNAKSIDLLVTNLSAGCSDLNRQYPINKSVIKNTCDGVQVEPFSATGINDLCEKYGHLHMANTCVSCKEKFLDKCKQTLQPYAGKVSVMAQSPAGNWGSKTTDSINANGYSVYCNVVGGNARVRHNVKNLAEIKEMESTGVVKCEKPFPNSSPTGSGGISSSEATQ